VTIRLAHFSDVHLTAPRRGWRVRDALSKRAVGWANLNLLGRGAHFAHAHRAAAALRAACAARNFDALAFSGDASALGFASEVRAAADALGANDPALPPGVAVPGNHDLYVGRAASARAFAAAFAPWLEGTRLGPHTFPFARKIGHVWLVMLNSAQPNVLAWDARGRVGESQLARFRELCASLGDGPRIVVSHYPVLMEGHRPEPRWHRLRDWRAARDAAAACGVKLWLHGHRHRWYALPPAAELPFATVCAGSATQEHRWGYCEYEIDGARLRGLRRTFDPAAGAYADGETFELEL
jgi:3',5'-cyclic AMP phosphodiesterase CpdA